MRKKTKNDKVIIVALLLLAVAVILACIIVTVVPVKRTSKAQTFDLKCTTELKKNPLAECKNDTK